uniref:Uncharacterized protein n=1 Tax=Anopheles albimanus TaxID=7167 RepID=A0A182F9T5_ANOAL
MREGSVGRLRLVGHCKHLKCAEGCYTAPCAFCQVYVPSIRKLLVTAGDADSDASANRRCRHTAVTTAAIDDATMPKRTEKTPWPGYANAAGKYAAR